MSLGIAVIGTGAMGQDHALRIAREIKGAHIAAISDIDTERAAQVARACGAEDALITPDAQEVIEAPGVDAVLIAAPDRFHAPLTISALRAGRPVLCEKPLAPTAEECREVLEVEDELAVTGGSARATLGFMRRFDPAYREMKQVASEGRLGAALMMHCTHRNPTGSADGSEHTINASAVHEFDVIPWLLDSTITEVSWHAGRSSTLTHRQDPQLVLLETADGVLVTLELFVNAQYGYQVQAELVCESGITRLEDTSALTSTRTAGADSRAVPPDFARAYAGAYTHEVRTWVESVRTGASPESMGLSTAWDGYRAARVSDAVLESMRAGTSPRIAVDYIEAPAVYRNASAAV